MSCEWVKIKGIFKMALKIDIFGVIKGCKLIMLKMACVKVSKNMVDAYMPREAQSRMFVSFIWI